MRLQANLRMAVDGWISPCDLDHRPNSGLWYAHLIGMRISARIVAVLLLLAFGAAPMFAAIQCRQNAQAKMPCGSHCAMMMAMEASSSQHQIQSANADPSCCKMLPAVPATTQTFAKLPGFRGVALIRGTAAVCSTLVVSRIENRVLPDSQLKGPSQSILCTFLI